MSQYKIEQNISVPPKSKGTNGLRGAGKYPHCLLEVGESFVTEEKGHLRQIIWKHAKASGKKFLLRKDGAGYRCWRIS
jgi:hypothetical protein